MSGLTQDPEILDEIDQVVYIADMDTYELLFLNRLGRETFGCGEEYRGKKCFEVLQGLHDVCPFCRNDCLADGGETCRWDHYNKMLGAYFQLQDRQIRFNGRRARIEIAIDISERETRQQELKNALTEQSMLTACVRTLNGNGDPDERINRVLAKIGVYYRADRAYLFRVSGDGKYLDNTFEWCAAGIDPQINILQNVDIHYMDRWNPSFCRREAVVEADIEHIRAAYPDEYEIMIRQGIHCYMEAPLFSEGKFSGFLGVDNPDATMIGNSSAPILTMAYAISNALDRDAVRKREQAQYRRTLHEMTAYVPNAVGSLRASLTRNLCFAEGEKADFFGIEERSGQWDRLIRRLSERIPDRQERSGFQIFRASALLEMFGSGASYIQRNYRFDGADGKRHFLTTHLRMIRNPDTDEVEAVAYSLDRTKEIRQNEIFRIITDRSFDLVALIHLDSGFFEAAFLGESLPSDYRALLPEPGAQCRFADFCAVSASHLDAAARADYESRLSPGYMRGELERNGGSYEFTLKAHFADSRRGVRYRKLLHYRLDTDPDAVLVIESDDTEAVLRQQEALRRAKNEAERDRLIMDSVLGGIAVLRLKDGERLSVDYFNSYVFQMLGYDPAGMPQRAEEAKGTPFAALFEDALTFVHPDDRAYVRQAFHANSGAETFALKPYRMYGNERRCYWIQERVRIVTGPDAERLYYAAFHDVTEEITLQKTVARQLELEKQLRRKADAANEAKSDFLSRMSHDMRTPLNGIIGMTYLTEEMELPQEVRSNLDKIDTSSKFLLSLVNDILDMSKMESRKIELHPEPYPFEKFCEYLDAVIRPLCREKQQVFLFDAAPLPDCTPVVDITHLNRIYFNLLSNAVKYTPEGGTVALKIREKPLPGDRIEFTMSVSDNGIGMSEAFQKHLFEPFVQENRDDTSVLRGSGLGLAIVKKTAEAMGGTIRVKSEQGKGSEFTVVLVSPCVKKTAAGEQGERRSGGAFGRLAGRHILLCEDHPLNQEIARALLAEKGMIVQLAENGQKGADAFSKSPVGYFDCILMDLRMPVMDGVEAAGAIRAMKRPDAGSVPILAMTADAFTEDIHRCLRAGMNGHIAKPIDPANLCRVLYDAIFKSEGESKP